MYSHSDMHHLMTAGMLSGCDFQAFFHMQSSFVCSYKLNYCTQPQVECPFVINHSGYQGFYVLYKIIMTMITYNYSSHYIGWLYYTYTGKCTLLNNIYTLTCTHNIMYMLITYYTVVCTEPVQYLYVCKL